MEYEECISSECTDDTSSTKIESVDTPQAIQLDRKALNKYSKELDEMTINELTTRGVEPIAELVAPFQQWYDKTDTVPQDHPVEHVSWKDVV